MPEPLLLTLPYGQSANTHWNVFRNRLILSKEGRAYKRLVADALARGGVRPFQSDIDARINFYRPQRSGDIDGRLKPLLDSLNKVAWDDDDQIIHLDLHRMDDKTNPRVELDIRPVGDEPLMFQDSIERNRYRLATKALTSAKAVLVNGNLIMARAFIDEALAALAFFPGVLSGTTVVDNAAEARATKAMAPKPPAPPAPKPRPQSGRPHAPQSNERKWPAEMFDEVDIRPTELRETAVAPVRPPAKSEA